jgi:hypothetical protein
MRFLSVDPLAADYAAWSGYHYVLGNPLVFVDPDGKKAVDDFYFSRDGELIEQVKTTEPDKFYVQTGQFNLDSDLVPIPEFVEISLNSDLGHLARTVYAEGGGQSKAAKLGLAEVIRNRANDSTPASVSNNYLAQFSKVSTYKEVVTQSGQFESVMNKKESYSDPLKVTGGNGGGRRNELETRAFAESVGAAIKAHFMDTNTAQGATYFYSPYIPPPTWTKTATQIQIPGISSKDFRFYKY